MDWGLGIVIAVGSDSLVVDGPHALVGVLVPFKDDIHTITVEQCLQSLSGDGRESACGLRAGVVT